jgi:CheY-like chemotaxis protein
MAPERGTAAAAPPPAATEHGDVVLAPVATDLRAGTEVAGYRLSELVGRGGMGVVYRAEHVHLGRTVALKLLTPELSSQPGFRERFVREARVAASIHHPNVVTVYDAGEADGLLYLAMQYVEGSDLGALLERGPLDPAEALSILEQVGAGLDAAHAAGVVHRDVKPGNVLIDAARCYLTDFGLTRRISSATALTQHDELVGTLDYVAPEQIAGERVDARTDVYSLGCVFFQMLSGAVPFPRPSRVATIYAHLQESPPPLAQLRTGLSDAIDAVIAKALAKRPQERFERCGELVAAAREAFGGNGAATAVQPLRRAARRTVLIAAGTPTIPAIVRGMLGGGDFEYHMAEHGAQAVDLVRETLPDVVLLDWELPGVSAAEVARAIRGDARTARVRVVAVAARPAAPSERDLEAAGVDALLVRPFSSLQLQMAAGGLLDRRGTPSG